MSRSTGCSGLGLYLVKTILGRHGAECAVENTENGVKVTAQFYPVTRLDFPPKMWYDE